MKTTTSSWFVKKTLNDNIRARSALSIRRFNYRALDSSQNEIRLLSLAPEEGKHGIACTIEHVSLINPPDYVALSYCWGDPKSTKKIGINGEAVKVTSNLEVALRHLREKGYRRLWIDALCMNQKDKVEKSQQLLWMGSIYRRAREVAAWTGEDHGDFQNVLSFIQNSWDILHAEDGSQRESEYPQPTVADENGHQKEDHIEKMLAFWAFLKRPYWRRVWVIQELALAKQTTIHCGSHSTSWAELASVLERCKNAPRSELRSRLIKTRAFVNARSLFDFRTDVSNGKPLRFLEALKRSLGSLSTEPRDKVFALLGLVHDSGVFIPVPNYQQSRESICMSMTISLISSTSSLDAVPMLGSGHASRFKLPSWVPNWIELEEQSSHRQLDYLLRKKPKSLHYSHLDGSLYSAGSGSPEIKIRGRTLQTRGYIFDVVDGLSHTISEKDSFSSPAPKLPLNVERNPYATDKELLKAITRALTRHTKRGILLRRRVEALNLIFDFWTQHPSLSTFTEEVKSWLLGMKSFVVGNSTLEDLAVKFLPPPRELTLAAHVQDDWELASALSWDNRVYSPSQLVQMRADLVALLLQAVEETLKDNMRFMTTNNGYVGWAHNRAKKGDHICILKGCSVPILLRPRHKGGYFVVGDSYVEGIMKGEAMIGLQESDWSQLEIH